MKKQKIDIIEKHKEDQRKQVEQKARELIDEIKKIKPGYPESSSDKNSEIGSKSHLI